MIYIRQDRAMGPNITKRFGEKPATECERISGKKKKKYRPWAKIHRGQPNRGGMEGSSLIKVIEKKEGESAKTESKSSGISWNYIINKRNCWW